MPTPDILDLMQGVPAYDGRSHFRGRLLVWIARGLVIGLLAMIVIPACTILVNWFILPAQNQLEYAQWDLPGGDRLIVDCFDTTRSEDFPALKYTCRLASNRRAFIFSDRIHWKMTDPDPKFRLIGPGNDSVVGIVRLGRPDSVRFIYDMESGVYAPVKGFVREYADTQHGRSTPDVPERPETPTDEKVQELLKRLERATVEEGRYRTEPRCLTLEPAPLE